MSRGLLVGLPALMLMMSNASLGTSAAAPSPAQIKVPVLGNYDIRMHDRGALARLAEEYSGSSSGRMAQGAGERRKEMQRELDRLRSLHPGAEAQFSSLVGSAEVVRDRRGALTSAAPGHGARQVALEFLRAHASLYGLRAEEAAALEPLGESRSPGSGLTMTRLRQVVSGVPVFQSDLRALVDAQGRLVRTVGRLVPGVPRTIPALTGMLGPAEAVRAALATLGMSAEVAAIRIEPLDPGTRAWEATAAHRDVTRPILGRLVYFPLAPGVLVPAWSQVIAMRGDADWYLLVDARHGTLLYRKNIRHVASTQPARFSVYAQSGGVPAESPSPASPSSAIPGAGTQFPEISRGIEAMLSRQDPLASPVGWIPDGATTTTGTNVAAYL
ncbi:MAG TPA: hypothetical protein VGR38_04190, partial [Candidatus Polarisedimenticolia bacterium]|nr:hypothetical protein [Candidatus Polarisedimenticolia bacterium]